MPPRKKITAKKKSTTKNKAVKSATKKKISKVVKGSSAKKKVEKKEVPKKSTKKVPVLLRGMKDLLPKKSPYWRGMRFTAENLVDAYGYKYVETPVLEQTTLFTRSLGKGTDVVEKEMYVFEDKDGSKICLRPEGTASICRAFVNHGLQTLPQPVKMWYWESMFRHDRPQAGRYREFKQFGCETIGENSHSPIVDAELIVVAYNFLRDLGIDSVVRINSIGTPEDRENYLVELVGYLRSKRSYLSDDSKKRINKNPLRVLDSKDEQDQVVIEDAPQIIDWLSDKSKNFFTGVLEYLDEAKVPYVLTPTLVRGLDYYTDTVFELYAEDEEEGAQSALGGGGRYNGLIEFLGGQPTPACGFAMGLDRVANLLQKRDEEERRNGEPVESKRTGVFFAQLGEQARKRALYLIEDLRRNGVTLHHSLAKSALRNQMEVADKLKVAHTLILGQKEVQDGTILVRDMESGIQEIIDQKKLKQKLEKLLAV